MPVVPTLQPQVEINPSAPKFQSGGSQEQATAGGRQIAATGEALSRFGAGLGDIVAKEQERVNKVRLNDAYNQASEIATRLKYDPDEGYLNHKGAAAAKGIDGKPLADYYQEKLKTKISDVAKTLDNPYLQEQFDILAADLDSNFHKEAIAYEGEQTQVYAQQVQDATIVTAGNIIAKDPANAAVVAFHTTRARDAATQKGIDAGLDGEALDGAVKATMGVMHNAVISSLLEGNQPKLAKAYFDAHEGDYTTLDGKAMSAKLKVASDAAAAAEGADEIMAKFAPQPGEENKAMRYSEIEKEIRTRYADDPAMAKAVRAEVTILQNTWEAQETEVVNEAVGEVLGNAANGAPLSRLKMSAAWGKIPGDKQNQIVRMLIEQGRSDRANKMSDMPDAVFAKYMDLASDPAKLAAMSPAAITAMLPEFGRDLTMQLVNSQKNLKAQGAMATAVIDQQDFDVFARQMGLNPYDKKATEKERANLGALKYRIETRIAEIQSATSRPMTRPEKQELMKQEMSQKVTLDKPWSLFGSGKDKNVPVIQLAPSETSQVVVPENERALIIAALQQNGYEVNANNIRWAYLMRFPSGHFAIDD